MTLTYLAGERKSVEQALAGLDGAQAHLAKILARLRCVAELPPDKDLRLLDIGAAQGQILLAAGRLGLQAVGVEPYEPARRAAEELSHRVGQSIDLRSGRGESLPVPDGQFDVVHAASVLEHASDPQAVLREAYRVLRPGGVIWLCTTNCLCPRQKEIAVLPCFSWYPGALKRRILRWACACRPQWVGYTDTPALHWFTPGRLRRMLRQIGFREVYDRWRLRRPDEGAWPHRAALRMIRSAGLLRLVADICVPAYSCAGVK